MGGLYVAIREGKPVAYRLPMWKNGIERIDELGKFANPNLTLLRWNVTPGKKHCSTCGGFNGQVKTRQEWERIAMDTGHFPKSRSLACGGFRCGCYMSEA